MYSSPPAGLQGSLLMCCCRSVVVSAATSTVSAFFTHLARRRANQNWKTFRCHVHLDSALSALLSRALRLPRPRVLRRRASFKQATHCQHRLPPNDIVFLSKSLSPLDTTTLPSPSRHPEKLAINRDKQCNVPNIGPLFLKIRLLKSQ